MGFLDKAKGMIRGNKPKAKQGVEAAADQARKVAPTQHSDKVDQAADAAKKGIDKV